MSFSMKKTVLATSLGLVLAGGVTVAAADSLVLTFTDSTAPVAAKPGACSNIAWTADGDFRMCDTSGTALGGGAPLHKDAMTGGETWSFNDAGVLTDITGTTTNPGVTFAGSAAPTPGTNVTWQQVAYFFGPPFNFLAPVAGSLAGAAYGNATYIGGVPAAGSNVPFILAPVLEAQWGNTWFPLGQVFTVANGNNDTASGITFLADISNVAMSGSTVTFDFHMYANECIDGPNALGCTAGGGSTEDPGEAGFTGWTAQWRLKGSGAYTDTTAPSLASTNPANVEAGVSPCKSTYDVTFNEPMAVGSVAAGSITISGGVTVGAPAASNSNKAFSFPITSGQLAGSTAFTVTFIAGPTDFAGNALTPLPGNRTFTTDAPGSCDITAPTITTRSPVSGATDVSITSTVVVTFDETMKPATASSITVVKTSDSSSVAGLVTTSDNTTFTFTPTSILENNTQYTATVAAATAEDVSDNNLAANGTWSFTTVPETIQVIAELKTDPLGSGCTINPRAKFDPSLLAMLFGSFGWLAWRRKLA